MKKIRKEEKESLIQRGNTGVNRLYHLRRESLYNPPLRARVSSYTQWVHLSASEPSI